MKFVVLRELALAVASGVLAACAFPLVISRWSPAPLLDAAPREVLIFVAAALLFRVGASDMPLRGKMLLCWIAGVTHFAWLLYWLGIAMMQYGGLPEWQAVPALALLMAYCALYWAALPLLQQLVTEQLRVPASVAFGAAVVTTEWARSVLLTGFPWGLWGYSQTRNPPLLHLAQIAGVYGTSFAVAVSGALLWRYVQARRGPNASVAALRLALGVGGFFALGLGIWAAASLATPLQSLNIGIVQGSIEQSLKNQGEAHRATIVRRYQQLAREAVAKGAQVVVWPEAALPGHLNISATKFPVLPEGVPSLIGAGTYEPRSKPIVAHNSAVWVLPDGSVEAIYHKRHMVPFGEYVPLRWLLPIEKFVPDLVDYVAGESAAPVGAPPFGVLICYDGVFPDIARDSVRAGAEVLANLTNDAWYDVSSAPYQHRDFYVLRAVETGRWVVRAANTGVSVFVDPAGRFHQPTTLGSVAAVVQSVGLYQHVTVYIRWGDWLVGLCVGTAVVAFCRRRWCRFRQARAP